MEKQSTQSRKNRDIINICALLAIVIFVNVLGGFFFTRFDLTSEKRYTLSETSTKLLKEIKDGIFVKVYLEGEFNADFKRLHDETRELLDRFRIESKNNLNYEFININAEDKKADLNKIQQQLYQKGIVPTQVNFKTENGNQQQVIWPGAIVTYKGKEMVWQLFKQQIGYSPAQCVNNSVEELEYGLTNTIRKLDKPRRSRIAFIQGHGELDTLESVRMFDALSEYYDVEYVTLNHQLEALKPYQAIIVAQPDSAIDDKDQFIIDQFIMRGGKSLWCLDAVDVNRDTLAMKGYSLGLNSKLGVEEMLYHYGVRVNYNLLMDLNCARIKLMSGSQQSPTPNLYPWFYSPVAFADSGVYNHPIVKNLDPIKLDFVSSIDTISVKGVKKTALLRSGRYTREQGTPARISFGLVNMKVKEAAFNQPYRNVAVLLEGTFKSRFKNYAFIPTAIMQDSAIGFKAESKPTSMIVISDGDIMKNDYNFRTKESYELGWDKSMQTKFANETFLLNCMNYLIDGEELISIRTREIKLRLLDKKKIGSFKKKYQFINVGIPLALIVLFGVVFTFLRKRKYTK